jgi:Na+/melibiose symporter-like transporter
MFFILKGKEVSGSSTVALLLYALYNLVYALTSLGFQKLAKELSPFKALSLGYFTFSLYLLSLDFSNSISLLVFSALLFGLSSGITDPGQRAAVGLLTGKSKRGTYYGLFHFLSGSAVLTGNLLIGWAWELHRSTALILLAALSSAAALITYRIR